METKDEAGSMPKLLPKKLVFTIDCDVSKDRLK